MSRNITEVRLLNVPLESDLKHTLYFDSKSKQEQYFKGKTIDGGSKSDFSYVRKDNYIRYPLDYDRAVGCNYVMYRNTSYSSKWYYAFVTKIEFVNDGTCDIYIETDPLQTWLFDYKVKQSFVEREHVDDDKIGLHTVPEQLELGEYIINDKNNNGSLQAHSLVMALTVDMNKMDGAKHANSAGGVYNGLYSGVKYYKVTEEECNTIISTLARTGQSDAINSIFVVPSIFVPSTYGNEGSDEFATVDESREPVRKDWVNTFGIEDRENYKPTNLDGYVPRNKKLFTYPFCFMRMTNNNGGTAIYKYELFNNPDNPNHCAFYIYAVVTPGMSVFISPRHYNGVGINSFEGLPLAKLPICSWATDVYTNWLTQNAVNIGVSLGSSLLSVGTGIAGKGGDVGGGLMGIAGTVGEIYAHSLQPPQAEGNLNAGDVSFSAGTLTFCAHQMTIKKEYAQIIDKYMDMFGYKVNLVKTPNKNHRKNYWFTKCIDVNIDGAIPSDDMQKIKKAYNTGITFWKDPSNIQNYSVSNGII